MDVPAENAGPDKTPEMATPKRNGLRIVVGIAIGLAAIIILFWLLNQIFYYFIAKSYVDEIADVFDLEKDLAKAIAWLAVIPIAFFAAGAFSLSKRRRTIGVLGIIAMIVGHSLILAYGKSAIIFSRDGKSAKCYVITRDGVHYGNRPGVDPTTGRQCRLVTAELVERLREYEKGKRPTRVDASEPTFFDPRSGDPIVWYVKHKSGQIEIFDLMGFHPDTREELLPVTEEIVELWKGLDAERRRLQARLPPERIDPDKTIFFDPITGEARAWFRRNESGDYEFYNRAGFDPKTGDALMAATRDVVEGWRKYSAEKAEKKCYVITRASVQYRSVAGIDPTTGHRCRPVTAGLIERLREYEKGKRPNRIDSREPTFFDLRSGEPIVWYFKAKGGQIEIFDLMGFHPDTGEELSPIAKDIVELWKHQKAELARKEQERNRRPPQRIDPEKFTFFDPVNGEARVWYWRSSKGEYEFYDNRGFHPPTGDELSVITREAIAKWRQESEALEKRKNEEREQRDRESRQRTEREDAERREREAARKREQQSAALCDQLAANPYDQRKSSNVPGTPYDSLKLQASEAVEACTKAVQQHPEELRFLYQLARALQHTDRTKAFTLHQKLVRLRYPAAFDNLGWLYLTQNKDPSGAVAQFRMGVQFGDPDSMVSLGEMIERGLAMPMNAGEAKIALFQRAADLGHRGAELAVQRERDKEINAARDEAMRAEQARKMIEIFGGIVGGMRR